MRIVDRYILKSIIRIFCSCVLVFAFLYVLIDIASNLDDLIERKVNAEIIAQYYATFLPIIIVQTSSIAILIATLFTYSHLNHNNEVIALRTSGMNFWRIAKPAIFFSLFISALTFWINERVVPQAEAVSSKIKNEHMNVSISDRHKTTRKIHNLTFYGLKNRLYFIDSFDPGTYELEGITIIGYDEQQNIKEKIVALKGHWVGLAWKFFTCQVSEFQDADIKIPAKVKVYDEKLMDIRETPQDFLRQNLNVTSMNIGQLREYIQKFSNSGAVKALNNLRVDLHQKMTFPLSGIVLILVGLPFALMTGRRKAVTFTSLGIAIIIGFLYYVTNAVGLALGKGGLFPPMMAAWLAPAIFAALGLYFIKTKFN